MPRQVLAGYNTDCLRMLLTISLRCVYFFILVCYNDKESRVTLACLYKTSGRFSCHNSYLLTLGTLHYHHPSMKRIIGSYSSVGWICPTFFGIDIRSFHTKFCGNRTNSCWAGASQDKMNTEEKHIIQSILKALKMGQTDRIPDLRNATSMSAINHHSPKWYPRLHEGSTSQYPYL